MMELLRVAAVVEGHVGCSATNTAASANVDLILLGESACRVELGFSIIHIAGVSYEFANI